MPDLKGASCRFIIMRDRFSEARRRFTMPFIHVELIEGRSDEVKAKIAKEITDTVHKLADTPREHIHVVFQDMKRNDYFNEGH